MELSVVIPVYKSKKTIASLVKQLQIELKNVLFEVVLVNDGSPDNSEEICSELVRKYANVKLISLRKNFGEFNAVMAGLHHISGNYVVLIDDDFQNPPQEIIKLLDEAKRGNYEVVYSQYTSKNHSFVRNFGSWLVNKLNTTLLKKPADLYLSSFKLIKKDLVAEIIQYKGSKPYIDALVFRLTNQVGRVWVQHNAREEGESNYTVRKLLSLFFAILFDYSPLLIRASWVLSMALILISTLSLFLFQIELSNGLLWVLFLIALLQFVFLGILGEYIGRNLRQQSGDVAFSIKKIEIHDPNHSSKDTIR